MEVYLIILIVVMTLVLLGVNFYLLALYVHPDDKGWGTAIYCKVLVIVGLTLCQAQALMVPLDVANRSAILSDTLDMVAFWFFLYIIVLIFVTLLMPYAIFLYETDEEDPMCKRLLRALCFTVAALAISCMILFISWAFLKFVQIPVTELSIDVSNEGTDIVEPTETEKFLKMQVSLAVYIIAILSFFGWIFLVLFGGVGLFALPIDMINEFRNRPKPRKSDQMKKTKQKMVTAINQLLKEGDTVKNLDENNNKNEEAGCFQKYKTSRKVNSKLTAFKAKYYALNEQFQIFNLQLKYADTNPIIPVLKLIIGIIFFITAIMWLVQIIFGNIARKYSGDRPLVPWFNQLLIHLEENNAGFVGTFVFSYLCLYMLWCVQKGNIKFGIRIPFCCRFHPMKENETWMNSFLFNVILLSVASVGVIQLCISSFPTYTRNTEIYMIFGVQINYMMFYNAFYKNNVFHIAFVIWCLITLIYQLITCNKKPNYMKEIQRIRQED